MTQSELLAELVTLVNKKHRSKLNPEHAYMIIEDVLDYLKTQELLKELDPPRIFQKKILEVVK